MPAPVPRSFVTRHPLAFGRDRRTATRSLLFAAGLLCATLALFGLRAVAPDLVSGGLTTAAFLTLVAVGLLAAAVHAHRNDGVVVCTLLAVAPVAGFLVAAAALTALLAVAPGAPVLAPEWDTPPVVVSLAGFLVTAALGVVAIALGLATRRVRGDRVR